MAKTQLFLQTLKNYWIWGSQISRSGRKIPVKIWTNSSFLLQPGNIAKRQIKVLFALQTPGRHTRNKTWTWFGALGDLKARGEQTSNAIEHAMPKNWHALSPVMIDLCQLVPPDGKSRGVVFLRNLVALPQDFSMSRMNVRLCLELFLFLFRCANFRN